MLRRAHRHSGQTLGPLSNPARENSPFAGTSTASTLLTSVALLKGATERKGDSMNYAVTKSDDDWKAELTPEEYAVLRTAATERPWTGELLDEKREGVYRCKGCGSELFRSDAKIGRT